MTVLLASLFIMGLYCYLWFEIIQKNQDVAALLGEVEKLTVERESLTSTKEQIAETAPLRDKLARYFIPKDGVVSFLNGIQALGAENHLGFKVGSVAIEDEASAPDVFENVKLNLEIEGEWSDLYRFATLAELLPLRVFADQVGLEIIPEEKNSDSSKKKAPPTAPKWRGHLTLRVLKLKN